MRAVAEAPSKVIITGEHFVVHGAWALAAAIDRRVRVTVEDAASFTVASAGQDRVTPQELRPVERVVGAMADEFSFEPKIRVSIRSEVPEGSGLGSSAATMVALASALSRLRSLGLGKGEVVEFANVGEREVHGNPSGVDANASARGGVILYKVGSEPRRVVFKGERRLLVVFSGQARRTERLIRRVAGAKDKLPHLFGGLTDSVSETSTAAAGDLSSGDMRSLGRLLTLNHAALSTVGASTPRLDGLVDLLLLLGCFGAKVTGAGGGGSLIASAPEGKEKSIVSGLRARGLEAFVAAMPVEGVKSWQER